VKNKKKVSKRKEKKKCGFPNVFHDEFSGLPLDRKIDFFIGLVPNTQPTSIPLYRIA